VQQVTRRFNILIAAHHNLKMPSNVHVIRHGNRAVSPQRGVTASSGGIPTKQKPCAVPLAVYPAYSGCTSVC
jgi:hypothetical protein